MHSRLDLLNNLYHSNARQIDQLVRANAEISRAIVNIINREQHVSREQPRQRANYEHQDQRTFSNVVRQRQTSTYENDVRDALLALIDENTGQPLPNRIQAVGRNHATPTNTPYIVGEGYTVPITNQSTINRILESFLAPIDIYPTQAQIETATRVARYGDITRPPNTTCPISLDSFEDSQLVTVIRHCGHIFNTEQIGAWFRTNCRCPVCRYDIRNYRASQNVLDVSANTTVTTDSTDEEE